MENQDLLQFDAESKIKKAAMQIARVAQRMYALARAKDIDAAAFLEAAEMEWRRLDGLFGELCGAVPPETQAGEAVTKTVLRVVDYVEAMSCAAAVIVHLEPLWDDVDGWGTVFSSTRDLEREYGTAGAVAARIELGLVEDHHE